MSSHAVVSLCVTLGLGGRGIPGYVSVAMPTDSPPRRRGECFELSVEKLLRRAQPLPPREATVIEDLTDEEAAAFFEAIRR